MVQVINLNKNCFFMLDKELFERNEIEIYLKISL